MLSISTVFAQSTYIITGSGTQFNANKDGAPVSNLQPIQTVIDAIKVDASGADCIIQFGNGTGTLNIGTANISFDGGTTGEDWGLVTLTGKLTSAFVGYGKGAIYLIRGASLNSKADVTNTAVSGTANATFYNTSTGTLTISGGTVLLTSETGMAIGNSFTGKIQIVGGVVEARCANAIAVYSTAKGKVTVSGDAVITSCYSNRIGTISIEDSDGASGTCLEITGGTVENTYDDGCAIFNKSPAAINISGGMIFAFCAVFNDESGTINISGGTISGIFAVGNAESGTINISGGTVSGAYYAVGTVSGTINISGGTVSGDYFAVGNFESGTINISGGTISATTGYAVSNDDGSVIISGGTISATTGYAVGNNTGTVTISGGIGFAYGTVVTDVIYGPFTVPPVNNAVLVAWNEAAGTTTYNAGTSDDIYKLPATATAVWAKQGDDSGIAVANGANTGFIPLPVTITGVNIVETQGIASLKIFPNPTKGELRVTSYELQVTGIEIFDVMGKKLLTSPLSLTSPETTLNIAHLPSGIYFLKIGNKTAKIIKNE